jgi:hypothetical protein
MHSFTRYEDGRVVRQWPRQGKGRRNE